MSVCPASQRAAAAHETGSIAPAQNLMQMLEGRNRRSGNEYRPRGRYRGVRFRRVSPVPVRPDEGPLTNRERALSSAAGTGPHAPKPSSTPPSLLVPPDL